RENIDRNLQEFVAAVKQASTRSAVLHLVCFCPPPNQSPNAADQVALENSMAGQLEALTGVHVVISSELARLYPVPDYYDPSGDDLGHIPYIPQFFVALATVITRKLHALSRPAHKVIVLDLD